jgi:hypothetical protein
VGVHLIHCVTVTSNYVTPTLLLTELRVRCHEVQEVANLDVQSLGLFGNITTVVLCRILSQCSLL